MTEAANSKRLLEIKNLDVSYGPIRVVWGVSFGVNRGSVVSLIGPNGAGKTTTLKAIAGLLPARAGKILVEARQRQQKKRGR